MAHSSVDLLPVDIFMPEVDGFEVIREVRRRCPGVAVVAMSGGSVASHADDILVLSTKLGAREILTNPSLPSN